MLTKYYLHISETDYELKDDDLRNWDEIRCSYKRASYDGVVRSFTSQFEFVNQAKELLMALYLKDRFNASASISVHIINDSWEYEKAFECPLDFSTAEWESYTFKINSVDNSLAALIKANKSTKYEFAVDPDIESDATFLFNRLPIRESLTFEITDGYSDDTDGSLIVPASENNRTFCGITNEDEIYINQAIDWNDDQTTDSDSYMIMAKTDVEVRLDIRIVYDQCFQQACQMSGTFIVIHSDGSSSNIGGSFGFGTIGKVFCGSYNSEAALKEAWPHSSIYVDDAPKRNYWATVNGIVWAVQSYGSESRTGWENQYVNADTYRRAYINRQYTVNLNSGDKIAFSTSGSGAHVFFPIQLDCERYAMSYPGFQSSDSSRDAIAKTE